MKYTMHYGAYAVEEDSESPDHDAINGWCAISADPAYAWIEEGEQHVMCQGSCGYGDFLDHYAMIPNPTGTPRARRIEQDYDNGIALMGPDHPVMVGIARTRQDMRDARYVAGKTLEAILRG